MKDNAALIRLRAKPIKPVLKKNYKGQLQVNSGDSIECILDNLPNNVAYADIRFYCDEYSDYGDYDGAKASFEWVSDEPLRDFEKREESYKKKIKSYNTWYKKHEDLIVLEEKRKVKLKTGRDLKTLEQLEAKVQREMKALERQRKKMEKL
jgi:hypothetical protein